MNIFCFNTDDILAIFSVDDLFVLKSRTTALPEIKDTDLLFLKVQPRGSSLRRDRLFSTVVREEWTDFTGKHETHTCLRVKLSAKCIWVTCFSSHE